MRVLVAPDKFGGTLTATEAAQAIERGWAREDPRARLESVPVADGGDGTLDVMVSALGGERRSSVVRGPLGDPVEADIGIVESAGERVAIVEMARASGLRLLPRNRRDVRRATTWGTGELILAAARVQPTRIIVCIGGSATNDGGAGMAQALGIRLLDAGGSELRPGGAALSELATVDTSGLAAEVRNLAIVVATDVDSPLTGPSGASAVYGSQKGATAEDVRALDDALRHFSDVIRVQLKADVANVPGAGAAGGLGAGLLAFLGAAMRPGFDVVSEALGLPGHVANADVVVTGEGRFDAQTERGKAPVGMLRLARKEGRRSVVIAGQIADDVRPDADVVISLTEQAGTVEDAMTNAVTHLEDAAESAARTLGATP